MSTEGIKRTLANERSDDLGTIHAPERDGLAKATLDEGEHSARHV